MYPHISPLLQRDAEFGVDAKAVKSCTEAGHNPDHADPDKYRLTVQLLLVERRAVASALLKCHAKLCVDDKIVKSGVKLRNNPVQPMPIDINRLADPNLQ